MTSHYTLILFILILLNTVCNAQLSMIGNWRLTQLSSMFPSEIFSKDTATFKKFTDQSNFKLPFVWIDTLSKNKPELVNVWQDYFDRYNIGWYAFIPDTNLVEWTFTDQNDSELRIYDDSSRIRKKILSYWTLQDSIIRLTGFYGFLKDPINFKIESITDSSCRLLFLTGYEKVFPQHLSFKRGKLLDGNLSLSGLSQQEIKMNILPERIRVVDKNINPFMNDHERVLVTLTEDGHIIDSRELFPETGAGSSSALLKTDSDFLLIDCDGRVYNINNSTGSIHDAGWNWKKNPKGKCVGTFDNASERCNTQTASTFNFDQIFRNYDPRK